MSSMAKIFVVVNLLFTVVVFGGAATLLGAQDDYRSAFLEATKKFEEYKSATDTRINNLDVQVQQSSSKAATEFARANTLRDERDALDQKLAAAEQVNSTLRSTMETLTKEVGKANEINDKNQKWLSDLGGEVKKATQEMLNAQKALEDERGNRGQLEQQIDQLGEQVQELSAKLGDTERQLREANFWLDKAKERLGDDFMAGLSKGAPGVVNAVRGNLVSISVGSADGVRLGDRYHIRRGGSYVGMMKVEKVEKNLAVGTFDADFTGPGAPPQQGDQVYPAN